MAHAKPSLLFLGYRFDFFVYLFGAAIIAGFLAPIAKGVPSSVMFGVATIILGVTFFGFPLEAIPLITALVLNTVLFFIVVKLIMSANRNIGAVR